VTVLDGDPGAGKTMIAADLAVRVAGGFELPDGSRSEFAGRGAPVLFIELDIPADALAPRIDAAGGDRRGNVFVWPDGLSCVMPTHAARVTAAVLGIGARLVIVDTLVRTFDDSLKLEVYQDATSVIGAWDEVAKVTGAAVLLLNHRTKVSNADSMSRGYGSKGGVAGVARSMIGASRDYGATEGQHRYYIESAKATYSALADRLAYRIVAASVTGTDDEGRPCELVTARVDWLPNVRPVSASGAKAAERDARRNDERAIARSVIGDGFEGTAGELDEALKAAGVSVGRARIVRGEVTISERVAGARNARRWVMRAGLQTADARAVDDGSDGFDLPAMFDDGSADNVTRGPWVG
jgi:hypothetical protein